MNHFNIFQMFEYILEAGYSFISRKMNIYFFILSFILVLMVFITNGHTAISETKSSDSKDVRSSINSDTIQLPDGYVQYGPFDEKGIPMRDFGRSLGTVYHPLVVAEYGSYYHGLFVQTGDAKWLRGLSKMCNWLIENQCDNGAWYYHWPNSYAGVTIDPPWASSVTQGFGAQTLIKYLKLMEDKKKYLPVIKKALLFGKVPVNQGGIGFDFGDGCLFFEEMPGNKPTHILNGHLTFIMSLMDYLEIEPDEDIRDLLNSGIKGLLKTIHFFDSGFWSRYDMLPPLTGGKKQRVYFTPETADKQPSVKLYGRPDLHLNLKKVQNNRPLKSIDGNPLPFRSTYYMLEIPPQVYNGLFKIPESLRLDVKNTNGIYLEWPESSFVLIPIERAHPGDGSVTLSGRLLGHSTGRSYHRMVIAQLRHIAQKISDPVLEKMANQWAEYDQVRGPLVTVK